MVYTHQFLKNFDSFAIRTIRDTKPWSETLLMYQRKHWLSVDKRFNLGDLFLTATVFTLHLRGACMPNPHFHRPFLYDMTDFEPFFSPFSPFFKSVQWFTYRKWGYRNRWRNSNEKWYLSSISECNSENVHKTFEEQRIPFHQSPIILTELFKHNLINVSYLTACNLYQVMMTLQFLNDVANDAESTQK